MSSEKPRIRLFTELDAVLDTRYGLLKKHYPEVIEQISLIKYLSRTIDEFEGVSYEAFSKLYAARGDDALEHAVMSNIHAIIATTLHGAYADSVDLPLTNKPLLILNLWPYTFSESERANLLESFQLNYGAYATVTLVNIALAELTPDYVKEHFDYLIMYNTNDWLSLHNKAFETKRIPDKKLIAPALYQGHVPTSEELSSLEGSLSPFEIIHKTLAPLIDLNFIDAEAFSVYSQAFSDRIFSGNKVRRVAKDKSAPIEVADDDIEKAFRD